MTENTTLPTRETKLMKPEEVSGGSDGEPWEKLLGNGTATPTVIPAQHLTVPKLETRRRISSPSIFGSFHKGLKLSLRTKNEDRHIFNR